MDLYLGKATFCIVDSIHHKLTITVHDHLLAAAPGSPADSESKIQMTREREGESLMRFNAKLLVFNERKVLFCTTLKHFIEKPLS